MPAKRSRLGTMSCTCQLSFCFSQIFWLEAVALTVGIFAAAMMGRTARLMELA